MIILDGTKLAEEMLQSLKKNPAIQQLGLAVVQVGENAVSKKYVKEKQKACEKVGMRFELFEFSEKIAVQELKTKIREIGANPLHSGMIIQLPLPKDFPTQEILDCIPATKDVDVLSTQSLEMFKRGELGIVPPTVAAISLLLESAGVSFKDKAGLLANRRVVIVGRGRLVGMPLSFWFLQKGITPVVVDKLTQNIESIIKTADILVSGVGKAGLIRGDMVKEGAVVIDAGTSIEAGTTKGDVDFESVSKKVSSITKVPGGVGPLTVACLLENLSILATIKQ